MVQVPEAMNVAVVPETVQTDVVVEMKLTGNAELAVAARVSGVPTFWAPGLAKVMVCVPLLTVKLCGTIAAAV
jgi:hypothetical protein